MIDPQLLSDYVNRSVGFGDPTAPIWFVGLEHGGGEDLVELERRLEAWHGSGAGSFADLRYYCGRFGVTKPTRSAVQLAAVIAELMPLPSLNSSDWIYSSLSGVPSLESRDSYLGHYRPVRLALLRQAIREAGPRAVIFIDTSEAETWSCRILRRS